MESAPDEIERWRELVRTFAEWDARFAARASWSAEAVEDYGEAVLFLTDAGSPVMPPPAEAAALLVRAADVSCEHRSFTFGCELEMIVSQDLYAAGRPREAVERFRAALEAYSDAPTGRIPLQRFLAYCEVELGELGAAERTLALAFERCDIESREPGFDPTLRGWVESSNQAWLLAMGLPDHAARALPREREAMQASTVPEPRLQWLIDECSVDMATERFERVVERVREHVAEFESASHRTLLRLQQVTAETEMSLEDPRRLEAAAAVARDAIADAPERSPDAGTLLVALAEYERRLGKLDSSAEALDRARAAGHGTARDAARFAVARSRLARARGAAREELEACRDGLRDVFERLASDWASAPERADGLGMLCYGYRRDPVCEWIATESSLSGRERAAETGFRALLRMHELGSLHQRLGLGPAPDFETMRSALCGERRGVLAYLPGPESSWVLAMDSRELRAFPLAAWRRWRPLQREWIAALTREDGDAARRDIQRLGRVLAAALLPDELAQLLARWDEVSIVGWEWMGYLPFEPLPLGTTSFGDRLAVAYLPSLTVGTAIAARAPVARSGLALVVAPATPASALERGWRWDEIQPNAERAERLREQFERFDERSGDGATLAALRALCAANPAVLEIVAHGFYDSTNVPPAGFALAADAAHDGLARSSDVRGLDSPPLVVLAVCGAARGPLRSGDDGVSNVGGAFLEAGADVVAISAVDLRQAPAEELVDAFYDALLEGEAPANAMRDVRRSLRGRAPAERDLVHVVGFGFRPVVPRRSRAPWIAASLAGLGFVVLAARRWRR